MKKSAFTLIELLVVIAIIAILAGIALPAYEKVMERSRATQDVGNLRQLGTATIAYLNDNDDQMFDKNAGVVGNSHLKWPVALNPQYIPDWRVFLSPFDTLRTASQSSTTAPISYGLNPNVMLGGPKISTTPGKPVFTGYASQFTAASQLILFAPAAGGQNPAQALKATGNVANGLPLLVSPPVASPVQGVFDTGRKITVVYADAHGEALPYSTYATYGNTTTNGVTDSTSGPARWFPVN